MLEATQTLDILMQAWIHFLVLNVCIWRIIFKKNLTLLLYQDDVEIDGKSIKSILARDDMAEAKDAAVVG